MNLRTYVSRTIPAATVASLLVLGLSACGGSPSIDWLESIDSAKSAEETAMRICVEYIDSSEVGRGIKKGMLQSIYQKVRQDASSNEAITAIDDFLDNYCPQPY